MVAREPNANVILLAISTHKRNLLVAEVGTLVFNTTTSKLNVCKTASAGASSWEAITSF